MEREENIVHHLETTGNFEALEIMLGAEPIPDIDFSDGRGETILMKACMAGLVECTWLLIRQSEQNKWHSA